MPNPIINQRVVLSGSAYDADALAFFSYLNPQPSTFQKKVYNTLIKSLKAKGNWTKLDRLWLPACEVRQNGRISIKNPGSTPMSETNTPTWTENQGYTGNGTTMSVNTNFIPNTDGVNFLQNNASYGVYVRSNVDESKFDLGVNQGTPFRYVELRTRETNVAKSSLNNAQVLAQSTLSDSRGLTSGLRTDSISSSIYRNGVFKASVSDTSSSRNTIAVVLLARNSGGTISDFSTKQISICFFGSGSINQLDLYNDLQTYMTSLGTQV